MALTKVSTDGVKDDAITSGKIPANAVGASELADNAVDTNAIADDAVNFNKISHIDSGRLLGRVSGGLGQIETPNASQVRTLLNVADGANQTTINNNADNRVITGSDTANTLNGESGVTIDGSGNLAIQGSGQRQLTIGSTNAGVAALILDGDSNGDGAGGDYAIIRHNTDGDLDFFARNPSGATNYIFRTGASEQVRIQAGGGISFNGDTAAANALNDYEEGTYTPSFANVDNSVITVNHFNYTKIGRLVHINAKFSIGSNNDGSRFGFQLPFTQAGSRRNVISAVSNRSGSNTAPFAFIIDTNQSYAYANELDGFGDSETSYATFSGNIIFITGTYEST